MKKKSFFGKVGKKLGYLALLGGMAVGAASCGKVDLGGTTLYAPWYKDKDGKTESGTKLTEAEKHAIEADVLAEYRNLGDFDSRERQGIWSEATDSFNSWTSRDLTPGYMGNLFKEKKLINGDEVGNVGGRGGRYFDGFDKRKPEILEEKADVFNAAYNFAMGKKIAEPVQKKHPKADFKVKITSFQWFDPAPPEGKVMDDYFGVGFGK